MKKEKKNGAFLKKRKEIEKIEKKRKNEPGQCPFSSFSETYFFFLMEKLKTTESHGVGYHLTKSIDKIRPLLDLQKVRRKGRTFYIPYEIKEEKARIQAMKWYKEGSRKNSKGKNQSIGQALASLFVESMKGGGYCKKKQKEHHSLAIKNKSSTRFRWW